jgi:glucose-6-phosphate 1-dehydrogenase
MDTNTTPTTFVIFGATGDLSLRKLFPALFDLFRKDKLPHTFAIVGVARRPFTDEAFQTLVREAVGKEKGSTADFNAFVSTVSYAQGYFDDASSYRSLAGYLEKKDALLGGCTNKLFHLAVHPEFYQTILKNLSSSGLTIPCGGEKGWTRVLVEKPFGRDRETAERLDLLLGSLFKEEQIFRIDHYLAKEALQNILAFRFSNSIFEPLWNSKYIESIRISLFEKSLVESRGDFYDTVGALRDVGQNHLLQMLALMTMEEPKNLVSKDIRLSRARALKLLQSIPISALPSRVVRAQYQGFREELGVGRDSNTETYFFAEARLKGSRWKGVPIYIESGKAMNDSRASITVRFKKGKILHEHDEANVLTFLIQPKEAIEIKFFAKRPGFGIQVEPKVLSFNYGDGLSDEIPDAYQRVLYDAIRGDQMLFASTEEIKNSWNFITPILKHWQKLPLLTYEKGADPAGLRNAAPNIKKVSSELKQ